PRGTLHFFRSKFLWQAACYERLRVRNFGLGPVEVRFSLHFRADFADIFEVRGTHRARRGRYLGSTVEGPAVVLAYEWLDGVPRRTRLAFAPRPDAILSTEAFFRAVLPPHGEAAFDVVVSCEQGRTTPSPPTPLPPGGRGAREPLSPP